MSMSDLMGGMNLATYPTIALILFLMAFASVTLRIVFRSSADEFERAAMLPLEDHRDDHNPTMPAPHDEHELTEPKHNGQP